MGHPCNIKTTEEESVLKELRILDWIVKVDVERTKEEYLKDLDLCECVYCQNYRESIQLKECSSILGFLMQLGIDPLKPEYLSEYGREKKGYRLYNGNYYVFGQLAEGKYCSSSEWNESNTRGIGSFTVGFENSSYKGDKSVPMMNLLFEASIPWLFLDQVE